jgi:hypothetical protein
VTEALTCIGTPATNDAAKIELNVIRFGENLKESFFMNQGFLVSKNVILSQVIKTYTKIYIIPEN